MPLDRGGSFVSQVEPVSGPFPHLPSAAAAPPVDTKAGNARRKQTLLNLLEALEELAREDGTRSGATEQAPPTHEGGKDDPSANEHLQKVGFEAFKRFERRMINLDRELRNFANAARQLGSSVGILSSAVLLRERLVQLLHLFHENAEDLFPLYVPKSAREPVPDVDEPETPKKKRRKVLLQGVNPAVLQDLDVESFPDQLQSFAQDVTTFLDCLNEFPEFNDEAVNASIMALEGDLKYWASCLRAYEGQFRNPAVQSYLHDLSSEMGGHLDNLTSSLQLFIEIGVPMIRFAQQHASQNLLNLSTVATFFSAVTATTMQFSYQMTSGPLQHAVNAFWFTSLVFSIQAAVNSLLGLTWKQAMYRSPGNRVPWWVLIWIKRSPLVFLVSSVACFSMGLVLFAYSSGQDKVTRTLTSVFSASSCVGLAAVSAWFVSERLIYDRHKGHKWLADAISETKVRVCSTSGMQWIMYEPRAIAWRMWRRLLKSWRAIFARLEGFSRATRRIRRASTMMSSDGEKTEDVSSEEASSPLGYSTPTTPRQTHHRTASLGSMGAILPMYDPSTPERPFATLSDPTTPEKELNPAIRDRWRATVRKAVAINNVVKAFPQGQNAKGIASSGDIQGSSAKLAGEELATAKANRMAAEKANLVPQLRSLEVAQAFTPHTALVKHLHFSPDGEYIATSSWDHTSKLFRVHGRAPLEQYRVLAHTQRFVKQVAWSPDGEYILTRQANTIGIWTKDGVKRAVTQDGMWRNDIRHEGVLSIAWCFDNTTFLSVEESSVLKFDLTGKILERYHFDRVALHDVAVRHDGDRMLCVGVLLASQDGLLPRRSRAEKQIIVYNLQRKEIESRVPVLNDVRDITIARGTNFVLVSYEDKAPPQLWELSVRLNLRHTYMPKEPVDFAGPSYFGGKKDQLVLCAGKAGDIYMWHRDTAALLHHIRPQALDGELTCLAWNHASSTLMFATGTHDGGVSIWTQPPSDQRRRRSSGDFPARRRGELANQSEERQPITERYSCQPDDSSCHGADFAVPMNATAY
ncbi:WD40 repeat-like protein [Wolfiporia cocos MD-104 SS10]|uniref:WD40 repeat-like protein n=1 Tax=Wolfiporia cocos (strain MD-104) TaxID=742152 RepID=A0A2H3J8M4_WOLCO|nr:WD40 repeat-like protein [Wolfiporia cocos MD-104 SS10]